MRAQKKTVPGGKPSTVGVPERALNENIFSIHEIERTRKGEFDALQKFNRGGVAPMRSDQVACRVDLAAQYGLDVAVFIQNIYYWVRKNEANQEHFYDGRYWAHSSYRGLEKWFEPLWSMQQIKRIVSKCRDRGLLLVGNYNPDGFTHTNWYSVTDAVLEIYGDSPEPEKVVRNRTIDSSILMQNRSEIEPANNVYKININKPPIVPREVLACVKEYAGEDQALYDALVGRL